MVAVERFDRTRTGDQLVRVHQEDMCQALGIHPDATYEQDGGPGVVDLTALLRKLLPPDVAAATVTRLVDGLLFNWLIGGTDAHAKNYGLLLSGSQVRLAPLYDVASMIPYEHDPLKLRSAMKVGGECRFKAIYPRNWQKLAKTAAVDPDALLARARTLAMQLPDALSETHAAALNVQPDVVLPPRMLDAVGSWSKRCLAGLDRARVRA